MYNQEKIKPYNSTDEKGKVVEEMFDNIASTYDTLNHRLSWNIDKSWRKKAIRRLAPFSPKTILDIATGTGDFAIMSAKMLLPKTLIGADISVTAAFGIRNFQDLEKGLGEMYRVLKKGGHLCIIELTTPISFPMKQLFKIYSKVVLPFYGRLISKDSSAYDYLNKTIAAFPQGETMMNILQSAGFTKTSFTRLTFGICTMYIAEK